MAQYVDLDSWPRRESFELFRGFERPHFSACLRLDVAPLERWLAERPGLASVMLACHWLVLAQAQRIEALRLRLERDDQGRDRVRRYPAVHGSTTVLRDDGALGFARLPWQPDFAAFAAAAREAIAAARLSQRLGAEDDEPDLLHFTTLPWLLFTSFTHARMGRDDAIPKFAFGRIASVGLKRWMPFSVDVHHALVDGLHVGQLVEGLERGLTEPQRVMSTESV